MNFIPVEYANSFFPVLNKNNWKVLSSGEVDSCPSCHKPLEVNLTVDMLKQINSCFKVCVNFAEIHSMCS